MRRLSHVLNLCMFGEPLPLCSGATSLLCFFINENTPLQLLMFWVPGL